MAKRKRIALYHHIMASKSVRGPMVFFPLFNREYQNYSEAEFDLYYFIRTDDVSKLTARYSCDELAAKNIIFLRTNNTRFKSMVENVELILKLLQHKISLLQVIYLDESYQPMPTLRVLQKIRWFHRIKMVFTITYNGVPSAFRANFVGRHERDRKYEVLFRGIQFDGIYAWYNEVVEWVATSDFFKQRPLTRAVESRFCDVKKYRPDKTKKKIMVWAGTLVGYKRPEMFLEALSTVKTSSAYLLNGWKVIFMGDGPLQISLLEMIEEKGLSDLVELRPASLDYYKVLNESMVMVSTQAIDHFPNLTINEGMASGCIIIATDIGRAHLFVKNNSNGYLAKEDSATGVASELTKLLSKDQSQIEQMMQASRNESLTNHTPEKFIVEIEKFWNDVLDLK